MKRILGHINFYKTNLNSGVFIVSGFLILFSILTQNITGIILSLKITKFNELYGSIHSLGAYSTVFFTYVHIYKNLQNRTTVSIKKKTVIYTGWIVFLWILAACFTGYLIPFSQMSFWGTKVISNFIDNIPYYGERIKEGLWGGLDITRELTVERFRSIHIILGLLIWIAVITHLTTVHDKKSKTIPSSSLDNTTNYTNLYPFFYIKDFFILTILLYFVINLLNENWDYFIEGGSKIPANTIKTPQHILPEWYFLPEFSVLKYCESKNTGILLAFTLIISLLAIVNKKSIKNN